MRRELAGRRTAGHRGLPGDRPPIAFHAARRGMGVIAAARNCDLLVQLQEEAKANGHTLEIIQADVATAEVASPMVRAAMTGSTASTFWLITPASGPPATSPNRPRTPSGRSWKPTSSAPWRRPGPSCRCSRKASAGGGERLVDPRPAGDSGAVGSTGQQVRVDGWTPGDPGRVRPVRHRRHHHQPRADADQLLAEHAGEERQAEPGPHAGDDPGPGGDGDPSMPWPPARR